MIWDAIIIDTPYNRFHYMILLHYNTIQNILQDIFKTEKSQCKMIWIYFEMSEIL